MTQEEKELLLKDILARLPYGIKCKDQYGDYININIYDVNIEHLIDQISSGVIKMILRPMSSMTEEESDEWAQLESDEWGINSIDWFNVHHFDYRGLIENGLALKEPEGMHNLNKK